MGGPGGISRSGEARVTHPATTVRAVDARLALSLDGAHRSQTGAGLSGHSLIIRPPRL